MNDDRFICTAENPWAPEKAERAAHPDAKDDGRDHETFDRYTCPHCGITFDVELPDY